VDSSCHELPQAHERVGGEGGRVLGVGGCGGISGPVLKEHLLSAGSKSLVGPPQEFRREMFDLGGVGGVYDQWGACEAPLEGEGMVHQGVNWEVLSYRRGGNLRPPVKGEVARGETCRKVSRQVFGLEGG